MDETALPYIMQLQNLTFEQLRDMDVRIAFVDWADLALTPEQVDELHSQGKWLIADLSIGEAESYESYWGDDWYFSENGSNPSWLIAESPYHIDGEIVDNFRVDYRDPEWQQIVLEQARELATSGADGLRLDVVDSYWTLIEQQMEAEGLSWDNEEDYERLDQIEQEAQSAMADFVIRISEEAHAASGREDFKIIINEGGDILWREGVAAAIDGYMKEELYIHSHDSLAEILNTEEILGESETNDRNLWNVSSDVRIVETEEELQAALAEYGYTGLDERATVEAQLAMANELGFTYAYLDYAYWDRQNAQVAVDAGIPVFSVEYPTNSVSQQYALETAEAAGFVPNVSPRLLDSTPQATIDYFAANPFDYAAAGLDWALEAPQVASIQRDVTYAKALFDNAGGKGAEDAEFGENPLHGNGKSSANYLS